ncbi:MAG: peroxiredoxin [Thermoplasmatota archaeon]|nr:peroxiredoxin [Halobacteriales archaeon]
MESKQGQPLPAFTFKDGARTVTDKDLKLPAVIYFYPEDDTPGCTKEACGIRDAWSDFKKAGLHVYGVSADDAASHERFRKKYDLPFTLLTADEGTLERLGIWKEKNLYGKKYMGISRETWLVGPDGRIIKHYGRVLVEDHADQLLADFKMLTV